MIEFAESRRDKERNLADSGIKFVRWQTVQLAQFGFVSNLLMGFGVAGLGFWLSLLKDFNFQPQHCVRPLFALSGVGFVFSIAIGIWCSLNRLWDFRLTAGITHPKSQVGELEAKRIESHKLGVRTWHLLYSQIAAFGLATILLIATLGLTYWSKLF